MRIAKTAAGLLAMLALSAPALFGSGFENTGMGITAKGMGGAFRAVANDWTAAYYNPAGYAFILDNQLGFNLGLVHYRNEYTPEYLATDGYGNEDSWGILNDQTLYNFHEILNKPTLGFAVRLPFWGETVFGLSAYQPFDYNVSWNLYNPYGTGVDFSAYNDSLSMFIPGKQIGNNLDVVAFQLSAGREFKEGKLALGIGLQLLRADLEFHDLSFRTNPRGTPLNDRPRDQIPEFTVNDGYGWGFGLRAGALWKATEKLNLAISAYLPFDITVSGTTEFTYIMPKNDYLYRRTGIDQTDQMFVAGGAIEFESDFETKLKLPSSVALGLAYQVNDKLTVAMDAEYTLWSYYEGLEFIYTDQQGLPSHVDQITHERVYPESEFFSQNLSRPVEWKNAGKVMLGALYDVNQTLTLLGGFSMDQSPSRECTEITPQFLDTGTKKSISFGGIVHINQWNLGMVTAYTSYPDIAISGLTDTNKDNIIDNFPGAYKASTYETVMSIGYRF